MWNGVKVGKVGTINIKSLKMLSLSCELILYYARKKKTVPWHYQDNDVSRVAFWMLRVPYTQFACSGALQRCCATSADSVYM